MKSFFSVLAIVAFILGYASGRADERNRTLAQPSPTPEVECVKPINRLRSLDDCQERYDPSSQSGR